MQDPFVPIQVSKHIRCFNEFELIASQERELNDQIARLHQLEKNLQEDRELKEVLIMDIEARRKTLTKLKHGH